ERLDSPDALPFLKILRAPVREAGERAGFGDQARGEREHVLPARAAPEQHREQLGVAQRGGAKFLESLLRALVDGGLAQAIGERVVHRVGHHVRLGHPTANAMAATYSIHGRDARAAHPCRQLNSASRTRSAAAARASAPGWPASSA